MPAHFLRLPSGQIIPLNGDRLLIGRTPYDREKHQTLGCLHKEKARCEGQWIFLPDPFVSRRHAILTWINDVKYAIEDVGSRSGTFVNDQAITQSTLLEVGDTIKLGELNIEYCNDIRKDPEPQWDRFGSD